MSGPAMSEFGAAMAHRRHQLRMSQSALADKMCTVAQRATFTRTEISRYERGVRQPGEQALGWFAESLGLAVDELRALLAPTRYYRAGIQAGHSANRPDMVASALSSLAYQEATVGNPSEAVLMSGDAFRGAPDADPLARTLFADRLAWAYARLGDDTNTVHTLDQADDLYTDTTDNPTPDFAYWLTRDEIDIMRGRTAVELHHPETAIDILTAAIARHPAEHIRETALYRTYLVEALIMQGDRARARR